MAEIKFKTEWLTQIALLASCGTPDDVADLCCAIQRASQGLPANEMSPLTETLFTPIAESISEEKAKSERNRANAKRKASENERPLQEREEEREVERETAKEKFPHTPLKEKEKGEEGEEEQESSCALAVDGVEACVIDADTLPSVISEAIPIPLFVPEADPNRLTDKMLEEEFNALWLLYPRKAGKADAFRHYKAARKRGVTYDAVEDGIRRYADYVQGQDPQYIAMGSTWFCGHRWEDQYVRKKSNLEQIWDL